MERVKDTWSCDAEINKTEEEKEECGGVQNASSGNKATTSSVNEYEIGTTISYQNAGFPSFKTKLRRLLSYEDWPPGLRQKPEDLAEAGFFYSGDGDRTMCFYCGGGLKDWEDDDDPLQQHIQWYSDCEYAKFKQMQRLLCQTENGKVEKK